jgi:hypothetical protein
MIRKIKNELSDLTGERTFTRTFFTDARATGISLDNFRRCFRWLKASASSRKDGSSRVSVGQISPPGIVKEGGGREEQRGGYPIPRELRRNQPNPTLVDLGKNSRRSRFPEPFFAVSGLLWFDFCHC